MNNDYHLNSVIDQKEGGLFVSMRKFLPLLQEQKKQILLAIFAACITAGLNLLAPIFIGHAIDTYIQKGDYYGVLLTTAILGIMYVIALFSHYFQTMLMGRVGQTILFSVRNAVFKKLESLPIAFFNQNKAGDLISRINNDTDKLNMFFSQSLVQFMANLISIVGAMIFAIVISWKMGVIIIMPAIGLLIFTQIISVWIKEKNAINLKHVGEMSAGISESIDNFKLVVAFNRRDYFRKKFQELNDTNYTSAIGAGIANNTLTPTYGFASNMAQLLVIVFGITFIASGSFTLGLLISFLTYVARIYEPLKQMAALWSSFQIAFASWDRIHAILVLNSNLAVETQDTNTEKNTFVMEFKDVSFSYPNGKEVLHHVHFSFERGKIYALVGPTGGGKTTTASLIARLYDPTTGTVLLNGKDIRGYSDEERAKKIGFILQEPFLFSGTVCENIVYGNDAYTDLSKERITQVIVEQGLEGLLERFEHGLDTPVTASGNTLSLGQKQLIAFMRAVLRRPELIILDEATANVDTITEQLLGDILEKLPKETTLIIIAHRLNTIENADEIFFVNSGEVIQAGSMEHAVDMLLHGKRET